MNRPRRLILFLAAAEILAIAYLVWAFWGKG